MTERATRDPDGYRPRPAGGPSIRSDVVDVYVFRPCRVDESRGAPLADDRDGEVEARRGVEFLQLLRAAEPLAGTWQPVMGHVERGETATACALRELREEVGLAESSPHLVALWALEQVHPFYVERIDSIVLSPRFAAQVTAGWEPRLNREHTGARWVPWAEVWRRFMWPGQAAACREIVEHLLRPGSLCRDALRVRPMPAPAGPAENPQRGADVAGAENGAPPADQAAAAMDALRAPAE
jgi:8-oxo-dGTP pyrophosphatase MutT (NUDIX family)